MKKPVVDMVAVGDAVAHTGDFFDAAACFADNDGEIKALISRPEQGEQIDDRQACEYQGKDHVASSFSLFCLNGHSEGMLTASQLALHSVW